MASLLGGPTNSAMQVTGHQTVFQAGWCERVRGGRRAVGPAGLTWVDLTDLGLSRGIKGADRGVHRGWPEAYMGLHMGLAFAKIRLTRG